MRLVVHIQLSLRVSEARHFPAGASCKHRVNSLPTVLAVGRVRSLGKEYLVWRQANYRIQNGSPIGSRHIAIIWPKAHRLERALVYLGIARKPRESIQHTLT